MKFKIVLTSRAKIKKAKEYFFPEFEPSILEEGKKRTFDNKLFVDGKGGYYTLYSEKGKLRVVLLHSYDVFEEIIEVKK